MNDQDVNRRCVIMEPLLFSLARGGDAGRDGFHASMEALQPVWSVLIWNNCYLQHIEAKTVLCNRFILIQ